MAKQFYRKGTDIYEAGTDRHIGPTEWNRDWSGKAEELTPTAGGSLTGTMVEEPERTLDQVEVSKDRTLGTETGARGGLSIGDFKTRLRNLALRATEKITPSVGEELSGLVAQGIDLAGANPAVIGQALETGTGIRAGAFKTAYANVADILKTQEEEQAKREQFDLELSATFLKDIITEYPTVYASLNAQDIESIKMGKPNQTVIELLNQAELTGQKIETQITELGGRKVLVNTQTGEIIRDLGISGGGTIDINNLSPLEQLQARNISTKIFGKIGGAKSENISLIAGLVADGMDVNQIEDSLRSSTYSNEYVGAFRDASENIQIGMSENQATVFSNNLDRQLEAGNYDKALETLKVAALASFPSAEASQIRGKDRTVEFLLEIKDDLKNFKDLGGNTNIFNGNAEKIAGKVGEVIDPTLRNLATKIQTAIISYRRAMSGVAFSVPESKEYKALFPNIDKNFKYNEQTVNALVDSFVGELDYSFGSVMGNGTYRELYGEEGASTKGIQQSEKKGIVGGYDIGVYATDPKHEEKISSIFSKMGQMTSIPQMNSYIQKIAPNSPVTGEMVKRASDKYGVSWEMIMSMMQQDSSFGTAGKAVRTYNPGNVGNDDAGNERNYGSWEQGVEAVAEWLSRHRAVDDSDIDYSGGVNLSDLNWEL
jgi:predicted 3-demethylubiquinone-9 3-methyltransferase (glyoxalase superfamily)